MEAGIVRDNLAEKWEVGWLVLRILRFAKGIQSVWLSLFVGPTRAVHACVEMGDVV